MDGSDVLLEVSSVGPSAGCPLERFVLGAS